MVLPPIEVSKPIEALPVIEVKPAMVVLPPMITLLETLRPVPDPLANNRPPTLA